MNEKIILRLICQVTELHLWPDRIFHKAQACKKKSPNLRAFSGSRCGLLEDYVWRVCWFLSNDDFLSSHFANFLSPEADCKNITLFELWNHESLKTLFFIWITLPSYRKMTEFSGSPPWSLSIIWTWVSIISLSSSGSNTWKGWTSESSSRAFHVSKLSQSSWRSSTDLLTCSKSLYSPRLILKNNWKKQRIYREYYHQNI
jgi:hypothetical protein